MAKLLEPLLADTDTRRQKRVMTGNGSIVGAGTGGLSTNDITVAATGQHPLMFWKHFNHLNLTARKSNYLIQIP